MFGIPNPLDIASDFFSEGAADILDDIYSNVKEHPETIIVPVVAVLGTVTAAFFLKAASEVYGAEVGRKYAEESL